LSDLTIYCAAEFLTDALNFLPRTRAVFAFECEAIDYQKQAEKKDQAKEKLSHTYMVTSEWTLKGSTPRL